MNFDFDRLIDRRSSDSVKWQRYGAAVLPLWVADMDFASPEPIVRALHERVEHGVFGYGQPPPRLTARLCERMARLYDWPVTPDEIVFLPGLVCGLNVVCRAFGEPGDSVLVQTPVYPPFLAAPGNQGRQLAVAPLAPGEHKGILHYHIDYARFESAIMKSTRLFILCQPHNPVGRSYTDDELRRLADICLRHDLVICSDEIHCDLMLDGRRHRPLATLSPEIAERCVTLMAPSKTFNMPGLGVSFAIVQNPRLRRQIKAAAEGIVPHINVLGFAAALAAYSECDDWLTALLAYLQANRDFLVDYVARHLPSIRTTRPEATYLAWLDCRQVDGAGNAHHFLLETAKVALNDGPTFGLGGEGFVRLNFGCPRATLEGGLEQIKLALSGLRQVR